MNETIYDDGMITVTPTEIRAKGFVLYVENISSISVATVRPGKWFVPLLAFPMIMFVLVVFFMQRTLGPLLGPQFGVTAISFLVPLFPFGILTVLISIVRISRLFLQTTGGPVLLAWKINFAEPYGTVAKYNMIKDAIETAMAYKKGLNRSDHS